MTKQADAFPPASAEPPVVHINDHSVDMFARAMKDKLAKKRAEGRRGWHDKKDCSNERLSDLLRKHVEKGDPVDVANFAMMIHQRGEAVCSAPTVADGWQPIETAPKDGTLILLAKAGDPGWPMRCRRWQDTHWRGWDGEDATHWMPLPEPPTYVAK